VKQPGKVITVIPSRLGSNRVPLKGMRILAGKTLVEHTLDIIKSSKYLRDNIYINSDSVIWSELAARNGVSFYHRAAELGTSSSLIDDYLYDFMCNVPGDYLAVVTPTAPLVKSEEFDAAWLQYFNGDADTLISAEKIQTHCFHDGKNVNFSRIGKHPRSQDITPIIALNFSISIFDYKKFMSNYELLGWGVYTGKVDFFIFSGYSAIDIDENKDFELAELALKQLTLDEHPPILYSDLVQHLVDNQIDTKN
jgi:N-acylneuraminate cytidylyltransferase